MAVITEIQLEPYLLLEELSQNSVVTVYRGQRQADQSAVIVKVIAPLFTADEFFARRLKLATRQTAKLEHPNIVRSYEAEQEGDLLYLVEDLDLTAVRSLAQVLAQEGSFSLRRTQFIVRQLASALDYAHQKSVTHGDVSANQVYLGPNDEVFIVDFGQTQALFGVNMMRQGYPANSPETMAPERVHGQGPSRHSDLYALGILCYQMLTGKPPFTGSMAAVLHAQAYKQPRSLHLINPGIPMAVSEVVERMLSKGMELRYNTGAEFARALAVACENIRTSPVKQAFSREHRFTPLSASASVVVVGVVAVLALALLYAGYRLGVSQQPATNSAPAVAGVELVVTPTKNVSQPTAPTPVASPTPARMSASDTLLPTRIPVSDLAGGTLLPTATPTPRIASPTPTVTKTPRPPQPTPTAGQAEAAAAPVLAVPVGQSLLIFTNPTGHDLVVDLTGPSSASSVIPPFNQKEFILTPGRYQMVLHTPTGKFLASRTLEFDLSAGQVINKDYYTDYDAQAAQVSNN